MLNDKVKAKQTELEDFQSALDEAVEAKQEAEDAAAPVPPGGGPEVIDVDKDEPLQEANDEGPNGPPIPAAAASSCAAPRSSVAKHRLSIRGFAPSAPRKSPGIVFSAPPRGMRRARGGPRGSAETRRSARTPPPRAAAVPAVRPAGRRSPGRRRGVCLGLGFGI